VSPGQWAELRQVGFATLDHEAAVRTATDLLALGPGFGDPLLAAMGLADFTAPVGPDTYVEVLAPAPISQQRALLKHEIEALALGGPRKALYTTLDAAVVSMRARYDSVRINAVVLLTDGGKDDPANNALPGLERTLRAPPNDKFVRVFTA